MEDVRAFTVGDEAFFLGVVALLNSLRITGNTMPVTVLDAGLAPWQRTLLEPHCELVRARGGVAAYLLKVDAPMAADADITLMLDSDIIVTGSLAPVVESAAAGQVCTYSNQEDQTRWFAEWQELFELRAPLRRQPYVNSGAVAVSQALKPGFLPRWAELCERMVGEPVMSKATTGRDYPFWLADQEALNALLQSELAPEEVVCIRPPGMIIGPTYLARTRVDDRLALACSWEGEPVTMLHAVGMIKPWQPRASRELRRTAYLTCLRRALAGPDLEVRVPPDRLPVWLRPGAAARAVSRVLNTYDVAARRTRPLRRRYGLGSGRAPAGRPRRTSPTERGRR